MPVPHRLLVPAASLAAVALLGGAMSPATAAATPSRTPSAAAQGPVIPVPPGVADLTLPDDPLDGTGLPPSQPAKRLDETPPAPAPPAAPAPLTYTRGGFWPHEVPAWSLPYNASTIISRTDTKTHDRWGVRMYAIGNRLYEHPVAQAAFGLENLNAFRVTQDPFFLQRAQAQATRLIQKHVESRGAWWFPYPFAFALHGNKQDVLRAPWYSGMAQGQALSLFSRLAAVDPGNPLWAQAAAMAFNSFLVGPSDTEPWVSRVDEHGLLWFEEYAARPASASDHTFNGHMFAVYGIYDYWALTKDPRAVELFDGGSTLVRYEVNTFRTRFWQSRYCLEHRADADKYHQIHIGQLLFMYSLTGSPVFARYADAFRSDYPRTTAGSVRFAAGTVVGYRFDSRGRITASKKVRLLRATSAPADYRKRIKGRAVYLHVTKGILAGFWVAERPGLAAMQRAAAVNTYVPARTATLRAGAFNVLTLRTSARAVAGGVVRLSGADTMTFDSSAYLNGSLYLHAASGAAAGRWLPISAVASY
jgi:hypothetical protein